MIGPPESAKTSRASTVVGDEDGFRMRVPRYDYDDHSDDGYDDTEATGLLGNGVRENGYDGDESAGEDGDRDRWDGLKDFEGLPWWKTPSVYWLIGPYALFTLAFGGTLVPKFNLIVDLVCKRYLADQALLDPTTPYSPIHLGEENPQCGKIPEVQRNVATFMLMISVITGALSAVSAPRLGALSDRFGRKPILAIASGGGIVMEVVTIFAANFPDVVSYKWLLLGAAFDGLCGSFTLGGLMSHSYTSDCTPPSRRAVAIGYLHACLFGGMALGPLLAGFLVKATGQLLSMFYVALVCHIIFIMFILFVLPESLSKRNRSLAREKHAKQHLVLVAAEEALLERSGHGISSDASPTWTRRLHRNFIINFAALRRWNPLEPLKILMPTGPGAGPARRNLIVLATIDAILLATAISSGQVILLYIEFLFGWGNFETSILISGLSMVRVAVLTLIFPIINYIFRIRPAKIRRARDLAADPTKPLLERNAGADTLDVWVLRAALLSDILGVIGYIFARSPHVFVLSCMVTALGGLGSATIQSSLTKTVPPSRVGQLLGATGFLHATAKIVAPIVFNGMYAATIETCPQAVFVLLLCIFCVLVGLSVFFRPHVYLTEMDMDEPTETRPTRAVESDEEVLEDEVLAARL